MADSIVSYVIRKLIDQLLHEAKLLHGARGKFERLKAELERMQGFLKDADTKQDDERVRNWVSEIRDVAYDVEDLIDNFILQVKYRQRRGFIERYASIFKYWFDMYSFEKEIESIQVRIQDISTSRETYGIRNIGEGMSSASSERLRDLRRSSPRDLGKDIVGFEEDTAKLVSRLVKNDDRNSVISIVGMGGLGKTTLATKVYNHCHVGNHFDRRRAWVYVSQDCRTRDILQEILRQITNTPAEELQQLGEVELEEKLRRDLETERFLVVLDDIWTTEAWDYLARALPTFPLSNGSRLLLTTRNREVTLYADARSIPHELRPLSKEDSWELFCRKALIFMDSTVDTSCPPGLEDIGREIVAKCDGLPLPIILIGGLLSRRNQSPSQWKSVLGNLRSHFVEASAILDLSYNDLPYYLKSCFLYVAHFPEDYVIKVPKLLQLWMAEGLIPQQGERMESTAEDYLNDLIERNMVQAVKLSLDGRVKECRIHDLLRELCISRAKEEIFIEIYGNRDLSNQDKTRHLAVHSDVGMFLKSPSSPRRLRSLIVFHFASRYLNPSIEIKVICTSFQLLRVLDLENGRMERLPREIGKLINLRYLSLRNTGISVLPLSMRYLQSLQTLDIRDVKLKEIPNVIGKLENLRHLHMSGKRMIVGQMKIDSLKHLQTLSYINVLNWKGNNSKLLSKSKMRKLSVVADEDCTDDDLLEFFNSIADLKNLSSLHLIFDSCTDDNEFPSLTGGLSSLHRLDKLSINGIWGVPMQHSMPEFPKNLFQLTLNGSLLRQIEIEVLGKLPKLSILRLRRCTLDQNQLIFFANGFPQLNLLVLDSLDKLEELKKEEGAMPRLQRLRITDCPRLIIPFCVSFVSDVQELEFNDMPQRVEDEFRKLDSYEDFRIRSVIFTKSDRPMKQEAVIKVQITGAKSRSKALMIAALEERVTSVAMAGPDMDQVVVTGNGVNLASLTRSLRKKLGHARLCELRNYSLSNPPSNHMAMSDQSGDETLSREA